MSQFQTFPFPGAQGGRDPLFNLMNPMGQNRRPGQQAAGPYGQQAFGPMGYQTMGPRAGGAPGRNRRGGGFSQLGQGPGFNPAPPVYRGGPGQQRPEGYAGLGRNERFEFDRERNMALIWDALNRDMINAQNAMDAQFGRNQQQIMGMEGAIQGGIGRMEQAAQGQRQNLQGIAAGVEGLGDQARQRFEQFRDQQMGQAQGQIGEANRLAQEAAGSANRFAEEARQSYERTISQFKDTSAQDAANAAFGLRRNVQSQLQMLEADPNMTPAEKQAARMQMTAETESTVTQAVGGIFSNMNQQVANMGANLANIIQNQSQAALAGGQLTAGTAMSGAQLTGQMGQAFGAQTLQAEQMGLQMRELGASLRTMGENAYAAAMMQIPVFELQGRQAMAQFVQENRYSPVSIFAGLAAGIQASTTPGLQGLTLPGSDRMIQNLSSSSGRINRGNQRRPF